METITIPTLIASAQKALDAFTVAGGCYPNDCTDERIADMLSAMRHLCDHYGFSWEGRLNCADALYQRDLDRMTTYVLTWQAGEQRAERDVASIDDAARIFETELMPQGVMAASICKRIDGSLFRTTHPTLSKLDYKLRQRRQAREQKGSVDS